MFEEKIDVADSKPESADDITAAVMAPIPTIEM